MDQQVQWDVTVRIWCREFERVASGETFQLVLRESQIVETQGFCPAMSRQLQRGQRTGDGVILKSVLVSS
jgi:hypothetical protein